MTKNESEKTTPDLQKDQRDGTVIHRIKKQNQRPIDQEEKDQVLQIYLGGQKTSIKRSMTKKVALYMIKESLWTEKEVSQKKSKVKLQGLRMNQGIIERGQGLEIALEGQKIWLKEEITRILLLKMKIILEQNQLRKKNQILRNLVGPLDQETERTSNLKVILILQKIILFQGQKDHLKRLRKMRENKARMTHQGLVQLKTDEIGNQVSVIEDQGRKNPEIRKVIRHLIARQER